MQFDIFQIDSKKEPEKILSQDRPPRPVRQLGFNAFTTPYDLYHFPPMRTGVCDGLNWEGIGRLFYIVSFDILRGDEWVRLAKLWHFTDEQISVIALQEAGALQPLSTVLYCTCSRISLQYKFDSRRPFPRRSRSIVQCIA